MLNEIAGDPKKKEKKEKKNYAQLVDVMNEFFELKTIIELEELFPKCLHYSQSTSVSMSLAINVAKKGLTKNLRCIRGMASMDFVSSPVLISQPEEKELWQSILDSCYQNNKPLITTTDQHLPLKSE